MHIQDVILLTVMNEQNQILQGRPMLQKKLYFLSKLKQVDYGFRPHYYGPYSSLVAENLDILTSARFLKHEVSSIEIDQNVFNERRIDTYSLTEDAKSVMSEIQKEIGYSDWKRKIEDFNSNVFSSDFNVLSIAAKADYTLNQHRITAAQVREFVKNCGYRINKSDLANVLSFFEAFYKGEF